LTVPPPELALDQLRSRLAGDQPIDALLDGWASLEAAVAHDPAGIAEALGKAAGLDASSGYAAVIPAGATGSAVMSPSGHLASVDPAFIRWFGDPRNSPALRRLIRLAHKQGQASGLVETDDGRLLAACAATESLALRWPLSEPSRAQLVLPGRRIGLLVFAPSRVSDLAARACAAFGLTPLEARVAEALLDAGTLEDVARRIGVSRETAREALAKALRKAGARRTPDIVRRMMDLMSGMRTQTADVQQVLRTVFGATPAEAAVAARVAEGRTAREVAADLGVKETTVRGQLKSVFAKTGVGKTKDLVRLTVEASALSVLTGAAETVVEHGDPDGALRIVAAPGGQRRAALVDYGPRGGRPLVVSHNFTAGRMLPIPFARKLQKAGFRPILPQRPGYGLTDPATGPQLETSADDLAAILDALKLQKADLLLQDGSAAAGLTFAARHPDRTGRGVLINPWPPRTVPRTTSSPSAAVSRLLFKHPELIAPFAEMLRRQSRSDMLARLISRTLSVSPSDRRLVEDPAVLAWLVRDAQALSARSSAGFAAEVSAYAHGWEIPAGLDGRRWRLAFWRDLHVPPDLTVWQTGLPGAEIFILPGGGFLAYQSDPDAVIRLLEDA